MEQRLRRQLVRLNTITQDIGVIHTDFERGFICAEVYNYKDIIEFGMFLRLFKALVRNGGRS